MMAPAGATIATTTKQKRNRFVIIIVIIVLMIAMKKGIKKAGRQDDGPSINHPAGGVGGHRGCRNDTMRGANGVVWDSSLATWIFLTFFSTACVDFLGRLCVCACACTGIVFLGRERASDNEHGAGPNNKDNNAMDRPTDRHPRKLD
jgi:hypothetical protein